MPERPELAHLRAAAKAGDMAAAGELSEILLDDDDLAGAEYWSRKAVASGSVAAQMVLGIVLSDMGNEEEGTSWLRAAAASKDPQFADKAGDAASVLFIELMQKLKVGHVRPEQVNFDEAEQWMKTAMAAGIGVPHEYFEELKRDRWSDAQSGAGQGSGAGVLQTFDVSSVMFYDGSGHRLGPSMCTLTTTKFIIDDARGGISQILLRDITGISTPSRFASPKLLRITCPGVAYDVYCRNKGQRNHLSASLSRAILG